MHGDDNMWSLPGVQAALLEAVVATGTPTVLVCYLVITPISHRAGVLGLGSISHRAGVPRLRL